MDYQEIINNYLKWIKDNTVIKSLSDKKTLSISTPFLDRHNDHIDIYLFKDQHTIILSDKGFTLRDLKMSGFDISTPKRESILRSILNGFGVKNNGNDELYVEANLNNIGQKKHYLLQAILSVNDMFHLAQETVYSLFKEDVELFLRSHDIYFTKDIKLTGKSGFDHNIDFLIPASKSKIERLIKTINTPKKDSVLSAIMAYMDLENVRGIKTKNVVIYNDTEKELSKELIGAFNPYGIDTIPWSKKENCLEVCRFN